MRFLVLSEREIDRETELNQFLTLAEPDEIEVILNEISAKEYIEKHLFQSQKHLDLILILRQDRYLFEKLMDEDTRNDSFIDWIRDSHEEYSDSNFNFKSIPVIIFDTEIHERYITSSSFQNTKYDLILPFSFFWGHNGYFIETLGKPIYHWIQTIGDELDNLDLDLSFNFAMSCVAKNDTLGFEILSESFLRKQQSLDYLWTNNNIRLIERTSDEWERLIKYSLSNPRKRNEKDIHKLIKANDLILKGENFRKTIYEHHFYYPNSQKYVEPDFVNLPHSYSFAQPEIFEVKLINKSIFSKKFKRLSTYGRKSLAQVTEKYRSYFSDFEINNAELLQVALPDQDYKYTLLIGHNELERDNADYIRNIETERNLSILSFDELMSRYGRLYSRIKRFRLS